MISQAKIIKHPYITINNKVRNGEPIVKGTSIRVLDIAVKYKIEEMTPEEIIIAYPHLELPHIHDALSCYYEHKYEFDKTWKDILRKTNISMTNQIEFL